MLILLAVTTMALGNIVAIAQTNLKRMLAYSTIAHMGFLLLGIIAGQRNRLCGIDVLRHRLCVNEYGRVRRDHRTGVCHERIGFNCKTSLVSPRRSPWVAFLMMVLMFSLAGVPPFAGFWAKWFVLKEVVAAGYSWLAAVGRILFPDRCLLLSACGQTHVFRRT